MKTKEIFEILKQEMPFFSVEDSSNRIIFLDSKNNSEFYCLIYKSEKIEKTIEIENLNYKNSFLTEGLSIQEISQKIKNIICENIKDKYPLDPTISEILYANKEKRTESELLSSAMLLCMERKKFNSWGSAQRFLKMLGRFSENYDISESIFNSLKKSNNKLFIEKFVLCDGVNSEIRIAAYRYYTQGINTLCLQRHYKIEKKLNAIGDSHERFSCKLPVDSGSIFFGVQELGQIIGCPGNLKAPLSEIFPDLKKVKKTRIQLTKNCDKFKFVKESLKFLSRLEVEQKIFYLPLYMRFKPDPGEINIVKIITDEFRNADLKFQDALL
jgi:hypothetical protein